MSRQALFAGLVFDEFDHPLEAGFIGPEPAYIINDAGFRRHIPAEQIDRFILNEMKKMIIDNDTVLVVSLPEVTVFSESKKGIVSQWEHWKYRRIQS